MTDIERAGHFYEKVLAIRGKRISPGRHYFDCEGTILACYDPKADGDGYTATPIPEPIYLSVDDLEAVFQRAEEAGAQFPKTWYRMWGRSGRSRSDRGVNDLSTQVIRSETRSALSAMSRCLRDRSDRGPGLKIGLEADTAGGVPGHRKPGTDRVDAAET